MRTFFIILGVVVGLCYIDARFQAVAIALALVGVAIAMTLPGYFWGTFFGSFFGTLFGVRFSGRR